ncbi:FkbM family methyltransferase [Phenylobacterium sp.]|uniref:FkbM family methyltransferase n=1 Tax=Phenylobacterium sp. TaxID=1871053 RepID=UPI002FE3C6FC
MTEPALKSLQTRHGPMLAFRGDRFITACLEAYGEFSYAEWLLLEQMAKPGLPVVEAGANIGLHTVPLARRCAPATLYAFEPQQRVFQALCANLALNDLGNVVALPDACGAEPGWASMPPVDYLREPNVGGAAWPPPAPRGSACG